MTDGLLGLCEQQKGKPQLRVDIAAVYNVRLLREQHLRDQQVNRRAWRCNVFVSPSCRQAGAALTVHDRHCSHLARSAPCRYNERRMASGRILCLPAAARPGSREFACCSQNCPRYFERNSEMNIAIHPERRLRRSSCVLPALSQLQHNRLLGKLAVCLLVRHDDAKVPHRSCSAMLVTRPRDHLTVMILRPCLGDRAHVDRPGRSCVRKMHLAAPQ